MKLLSVRLSDAEHETLRSRADAAGSTITVLVKEWIGSFGGSEVVPPPAVGSLPPESGSSAASLPPPAPDLFEANRSDMVTMVVDANGVHDVDPPKPLPEFLAAPVDDCPVCGHDRQASSHLGGEKCQYKIGRRICGCTFEGF